MHACRYGVCAVVIVVRIERLLRDEVLKMNQGFKKLPELASYSGLVSFSIPPRGMCARRREEAKRSKVRYMK